MQDKAWDVFISHASEDKASVAEPLAEMLRRSGARVWLDLHELKVGDSLSEKIDDGLSDSHFGIVILSPSFFNKHWPRRELAGLRSREEDGQKVILPVWHNVDKVDVRRFSPILSDVVSLKTANGLESVAQDLIRAIFSKTSPSYQRPSIIRCLTELLDSDADRSELVHFLHANSKIADFPEESYFGTALWNIKLGDCYFDAASASVGHGLHVNFLYFSEVWNDPYETSDESNLRISTSIIKKIEEIQSAQEWLFATDTNVIRLKDGIIDRIGKENHPLRFERRELEFYANGNVIVKCQIFCGRRQFIDKNTTRHVLWSDLRMRLNRRVKAHRAIFDGIEVRSYDYIVDRYLRFVDPRAFGRNSRSARQ